MPRSSAKSAQSETSCKLHAVRPDTRTQLFGTFTMFPLLRIALPSCVIGLSIGSGVGALLAQATQPASTEVRMMKLPLDLPSIGNVSAVKQWRFGRIESVVQTGASDDVKINIRIQSGEVLQTVGPRVLGDLARASNWTVPETGNTHLVRADYVERMIAFDVDDSGRIIAMISMEPMDRDRQRLARGL